MWGFQVLLVASGASEAEATATSELLGLIKGEPRLADWSRTTSFRVVTRDDVVAAAQAADREARAAAASSTSGRDNDSKVSSEGNAGGNGPPAAENALAGRSNSVALASADDEVEVELTVRVLADAFQRLVRQDKDTFTEATATRRTNAGGATGEALTQADALGHERESNASSGSGQLTDYAGAAPVDSLAAAPARIYLLDQYPASLAELQALLYTGEADCAVQGGLPLLPLIDGLLLVADPTRELREVRRKSLGLTDERRKSASQRQILSAIATAAFDDAVGSAATVQSVFLTANPLVRESYEAAGVGGLAWSDFVFDDVPCSAAAKEPKGVADLAKELLASAETLAAHKYEFKRWVAATTMVQIPTAESSDSDNVRAMVECYERILCGVYGASVGVSTVLFAMKEAVALVALDDNEESDSRFSSNQLYVEEYIAHGDSAARRLAIAYTTFKNEETGPSTKDFSFVDPCSVLDRRIDDVEHDMWAMSDLPGVGNAGRKGMPVSPPLSPIARSISDTELQTFAPFDVARVHLTRQVQQVEDMLGESWKGKLQPSRGFVEELNRTVLPQRLAQILSNFPTAYTAYYAPTDSLLLATLAATAPGRFRTVSWSAKDHVRHRPAFKDWRKERVVSDEYLTPRSREALEACVPLSSAELALVSEKTFVLFPSDQSVIRVYQTPRGYTWLSVYQGGYVRTSPIAESLHECEAA